MLGSSTCCRERENRWFAVQQWTWVNLLVFLPPKSTLMKKNFISIAYSNFNVFVLCIFVLKTPEKAPPASRIEMFLFVSKQKGLQVKTMLTCSVPFFFKNCGDLSPNISNRLFYFSLWRRWSCQTNMSSTMPRSASYGILPTSVKKQGKGRCMKPDNCKPEWPLSSEIQS